MAQLLDRKALQHMKRRITRYESLLAKRNRLDSELATIAKELGWSEPGPMAQQPRRSRAAANRARSRSMKKYWAQRKKQQRESAGPKPKSKAAEVRAPKQVASASRRAANQARSAAMRRYWAEKKKKAG